MAERALQRALEAQDRKDHQIALSHFREAINAEPQNWVGYTGLGNSLRALGHVDEAVRCYELAVKFGEHAPKAWAQLGFAYEARGESDQALNCFRRVCALEPENPESYANLAVALLRAERWAEAEEVARQTVAIAPSHVRATINLGIALKEQGRFSEATAACRQAVAVDPSCADAHWNLALLRLADGAWEEGWQEFEWRQRIPGLGAPAAVSTVPVWDGRVLGSTRPEGATLLVQAEQGLGDTLQFARYLRQAKVRAGAASLVLECRPEMERLLCESRIADRVVARGESWPAVDARIPIMSLPLLLEAPDPAQTLSGSHAYLAADAQRAAIWSARLGARAGEATLKIGIAWQGNPRYRADRRRSIALSQLLPFLRAARDLGAQLYSLQKGHGRDQLEALPAELRVDELGPEVDEGEGNAFVDTAAVMSGLDLVVSSDTAIPHLAGALGVPVWMLLSHLPDWRWGHEGDQCAWYPSMRLFRQRRPGYWADVIADLCSALGAFKRTEP